MKTPLWRVFVKICFCFGNTLFGRFFVTFSGKSRNLLFKDLRLLNNFWVFGASVLKDLSLWIICNNHRGIYSVALCFKLTEKYCWNYGDFLCAKIVTTILNIFLQNLHSRNKKVITIFIRNEKSHIKYLDIDFRINLVWQTKDIFQVYFVTFCISVSRVAFAKSGFVHSKIIVSRNFNFCDISSFSYSDKKNWIQKWTLEVR